MFTQEWCNRGTKWVIAFSLVKQNLVANYFYVHNDGFLLKKTFSKGLWPTITFIRSQGLRKAKLLKADYWFEKLFHCVFEIESNKNVSLIKDMPI